MTLSVALQIPFRQLEQEEDETIATYLQVLDELNEEREE